MALIAKHIANLIGALVTSPEKETCRLRVDQGQTGFFEAREFRFEYEVSEPIIFKFSSPINFILRSQSLFSHDGLSTLAVWRENQGADSGDFNIPAFIKPNNAMSSAPTYARQITINSGGSFEPADANPNLAGEYIKAVAATSTAQRNTVGGSGVSERGLASGDYYMIFTGTNASYRLVFEERP